jgi:Effector Associated Constant Component 1
MAESFELRVEAASTRFDADDNRWLEEVADFTLELGDRTGAVRRVRTPVKGEKGALESIIVSVTSAGAITAAAEFFKTWLGRDSTRQIKVAFHENGTPQEVVLQGRNVDEATVRRITDAVLSQLDPDNA